MAFTAMIGKELLELDDASDKPGKTILSTYVPTGSNGSGAANSSAVNTGSSGEDEGSFKDTVSAEEHKGVSAMKASRPPLDSMMGDDESRLSSGTKSEASPVPKEPTEEKKTERLDSSMPNNTLRPVQPRRRFRDSLSALQIEEAKATGRAQLGLAFEMLTMMKKRALKADPEAYQCLIDACGRVGDTKRATDLLAKMHEDGIVADGTVYACLVSAFSAETAWKKGTKEEDLPGMQLSCVMFATLDSLQYVYGANIILTIFRRMGE